MILKWLRSSHRMCAARHCPQFATCRQQLTWQHVGSQVSASVFWTVAIPTLSQRIRWRGYFKSQMHGDVGKLKVQPQVCKAIPRAAPSVEVLWPRCNAPEIPKPLQASRLQGFFFKATTGSDGLRWHQTFKSCNSGPNLLNKNSEKFIFLNFFRACQRRNIPLMTLTFRLQQDAIFKLQLLRNAFRWNLAFFTVIILHVSSFKHSYPAEIQFVLFEILSSMKTRKPRISTLVVRSSWVPKNEISFGTLAGVPRGCTKPLACRSVSRAKRIPQHLGLRKGGGTKASYASLSLKTVEYFRTSNWNLGHADWMRRMNEVIILCSVFRHHVVRESGSLKFLWQNVSIHWNRISIIVSCFLQSCATVINEPRFSFVDCESGEYHFTGAGGYSLVYSCPVHLTTSHSQTRV